MSKQNGSTGQQANKSDHKNSRNKQKQNNQISADDYLMIERKVYESLYKKSMSTEITKIIMEDFGLLGACLGLIMYDAENNPVKLKLTAISVVTSNPDEIPELEMPKNILDNDHYSIIIDLEDNDKALNLLTGLTGPAALNKSDLAKALFSERVKTSSNIQLLYAFMDNLAGDFLLVPMLHTPEKTKYGKWSGLIFAVKKRDEIFNDIEIQMIQQLMHPLTLGIISFFDKDKLYKLAHTDELTSLGNLKYFKEKITEKIESDDPDLKKFSIFSVKLNDFNKIMSARGERVSDFCIRKIGQMIKKILQGYNNTHLSRSPGVVYLFMLNVNDEGKLKKLAQDILSLFNEPIKIEGYQIHLSASVGIWYDPTGFDLSNQTLNADKLLQRNNIALEKAKEKAHNQTSNLEHYAVYNDILRKQHNEEHELEDRLRTAIDDSNNFLIYYQPKCYADGRIKGFEALARWQADKDTVYSPDRFIPHITNLRLSDKFFKIMIKKAIEDLKTYRNQLKEVSINISSKQFNQINIIDAINDICINCDLDPDELDIKLELLETDIVEWHNMHVIKNLHNRGIKISVDDFGAGYSNLKRINDMIKLKLIDEIKIDKSLINGIEEDATLLTIILEMAYKFKIEMVAEGVSKPGQYRILKSLYPDIIIQGHLISPALPLQEALKLDEYTVRTIFRGPVDNR